MEKINTKMRTLFFTFLLVLISAPAVKASTFIGDRTDFRDETIYFVITTRFYDGDASNNTQCWDGQTINAGDPSWRGDFKGLIDKLDYIKALGFTAIWITPVVENASGFDYHGYHARNFSKVDHRYESNDTTFQTLIDAAHNKGMKIILDIVLNHTGNFGEEHLCKMFDRDWTKNQATINDCMIPLTQSNGGPLPDTYASNTSEQYQDRLHLMKNNDGVNHDTHNYWHHKADFNWDDETRWWAQIAGDCVDLNTENPAVYTYLINCYGSFIKMGVDGFRIDTSGHISRLTFNKVFIPAFQALGEKYKDKRLNGCPFYMYGEVCARFQGSVTYRGQAALSPYFYTWASDASLVNQWNNDSTYWDNQVVMAATAATTLDNQKLCEEEYTANTGSETTQPTSTNCLLNGNEYHTPDVSKASGFNVIDFPVHYSFTSISSVWGLATGGDKYYNDASYNVVYVDSHDYGPAPNDGIRFNGGTAQWAENMDLMFTFRGIPCLYYGSEIEFRKGVTIDNGTNTALKNTGRAYYGGYIKGDVTTSDFGVYSGASGNVAATLNHPLAQHVRRLNMIRAAVPALRKGQYSTDGCTATSGYAFKRRYTSGSTDSYALVTINSGATFTGVLNGKYTDCVTGDVKTVTNGTLTTSSFSAQGNMRVYVLNGPGKIGDDGPYLYSSSAASLGSQTYDGTEEEESSNNGGGSSTTTTDISKLSVYTPSIASNELSVFYEAAASTTAVTCWVWNTSANFTGGTWPGKAATLMGKNSEGTKKIYKWTYDGEYPSVLPTSIIFSNGGSNQTSTLEFHNHGYYVDGVYSSDITNVVDDGTTVSVSADKATGSYKDNVTVTLTASKTDGVIVYTTDGTTPTASSTQATGSKTLTFDKTTTLKAGALVDGTVENVITRTYTITSSTTAGTYAYFIAPATWTNDIYCWAWDANNGKYSLTGSAWPGVVCTKVGTSSDGLAIWEWVSTDTSGKTPTGIIFNNKGAAQTIDFTFVNGAYYNINGLTTGITNVVIDSANGLYKVYSIDGKHIRTASSVNEALDGLDRGVYIVNNKKVVLK